MGAGIVDACVEHGRIIKSRKNKFLQKLFRENKTSPLFKTPEKDFHVYTGTLVYTGTSGVDDEVPV